MFKFIFYFLYIVLYPIYRFHFIGRENIPAGPCVMCGNHTANIDSVLLVFANGSKGDFGFIAKEELFRFKPFGAFLRSVGAIPVKRSTMDMHAVKAGFSILKSGKKLLLFPEGTRVKVGMRSEPKPGAALFSVRGKAPMLPVYIPAGRKAFHRNDIIIGKPYTPAVEGKPDARQYQEITEDLMQRIMSLPSEVK